MTKLAKALMETHKVELEATDRVVLEQNYCEPTIVDVVITDTITGREMVFICYDASRGCFPY